MNWHRDNSFPGHLQTEWGSHTLSQATRRLLQAAMKNPLNQRFVLLCGSTIPVRPAQFTYSQLIAERRSRFDDYGFTREDREVSTLCNPSLKLFNTLLQHTGERHGEKELLGAARKVDVF